MGSATDPSSERILVLAPTGRDAGMLCERVRAGGLAAERCKNLDVLLAAMEKGAGALVVAQEALTPAGAEALHAALDGQEAWSDIPILFLTLGVSRRAAHANLVVTTLERANVILLDRPLRLRLFRSALQSAVRARRRQYQMRDLHRELSRAMQLSDSFVGILGHDLRTPLFAIRMSAEVIVRTAADARALRPAGRILSSADRMTRMIEQLLDFARVRKGRGIPLHVVTTNLGDIARQVVQELLDANPGAEFEISPSGNLAGDWDPDRLGQVVSNLVGNAVQHGASGSPVAVELDGTQRSQVRLTVRNRGAIPAGAIPTLFEPFKRGAPAKVGEKGLGLGLFIAREIVSAHGGELSARVVDRSTVFEATLPREARPVETEVLSPP